MKVIILAAGYSTRLYPLTVFFPKGLLPIGPAAVLDYTLKPLLKIFPGMPVTLVTNRRYFQLFSTWTKAFYGETVSLLKNHSNSPQSKTGAIGDLALALRQLGDSEDVLVCASDTLSSLDISDFHGFFTRYRETSIVVFNTKCTQNIRQRLGCVEVEGNAVISFEEKPEHPRSTLASVPCYFFPKEVLPRIMKFASTKDAADAPGLLISWLLRKKVPIRAYELQGFYHDVGTVADYNALCSDKFLLNRLREIVE